MSFSSLTKQFACIAFLTLGALGAGCSSNDSAQSDAAAVEQHADLAGWRSALAARRKINIERLHDYAQRGVFPRNDQKPGKANIFIDEVGTHCAVANLMSLSGNEDLVQGSAKRDNFIRLADVKDGALFDWIAQSGFTQEEVALIQEPYMFQKPPGDLSMQQSEQKRLREHFAKVDAQLRADTDKSIDTAIARMPMHILVSPPPTPGEPVAV